LKIVKIFKNFSLNFFESLQLLVRSKKVALLLLASCSFYMSSAQQTISYDEEVKTFFRLPKSELDKMSSGEKLDLKNTTESKHYEIVMAKSGDVTTIITDNNFKSADDSYQIYKTIVDQSGTRTYHQDGRLVQQVRRSSEDQSFYDELKKDNGENKFKIKKLPSMPLSQIRLLREQGNDVQVMGKGKVKIRKDGNESFYNPGGNEMSKSSFESNILKNRIVRRYKDESDGSISLNQTIEEIYYPSSKGVKRWLVSVKTVSNLNISGRLNTRESKIENNDTQYDYQFSVFPNPAYNELLIEIPNSNSQKLVKISIVDITGKEVMQLNEQYSPIRVDIKTLQKGIYVVRIELPNSEVKTIRFVKI
jgi:Secretion system C-terminal sorting domain